MKNQINYLVLLSAFLLVTGCEKHESTPGDTVKEFFMAEADADVDKVAATLAPELRAKVFADKNESKKSFVETKAEIKKCGGFKNFTSKYDVSSGKNKVEGYTIIEQNGSCGSIKQAVRLIKFEEKWLIDEMGPSIKL